MILQKIKKRVAAAPQKINFFFIAFLLSKVASKHREVYHHTAQLVRGKPLRPHAIIHAPKIIKIIYPPKVKIKNINNKICPRS
jgi:hypothetical protein